jgi:ABC-type transport system involved in multi-copper enzyme maturation permease subunit
MNNKVANIVLIILGAFLVFNGFINIVDDGVVLAYDITSILSGVGFILIAFSSKKL